MNKILQQLFSLREQQYQNTTEQILQFLRPVSSGIETFIYSLDEVDIRDQLTITWLNINQYQASVGLCGEISVPEGKTITLPNGKTIDITRDNVKFFKRRLQINLPKNIIDANNSELTIKFLNTIKQKTNRRKADSTLSPNNYYDNTNLQNILSDFDALTETQKQNLFIKNVTMH